MQGCPAVARRGERGDVGALFRLDSQLGRLRAFAVVTYPFACVPFLFMYFRGHGITDGQYGEIVGAYYLAMFVAEVPTGMLADRYGQRPMLVIGPLLLASGFAAMVLAPGYQAFVAGQVLLGLGHAVLSGPAIERITKSELDELVVTDTIPLRDAARACGKIRQLSVAGLLAETMRRIRDEESVSSLYID